MERTTDPRVRVDDGQRASVDDSRRIERNDTGPSVDAPRMDLGAQKNDGNRSDYGQTN